MVLFLFQSHQIGGNLNIVIISSGSRSDIDIIFLFNRCHVWMSSLIIGNERFGFGSRSLTDWLILISVVAVMNVLSRVWHRLLDILQVVVLHLFHMRSFIRAAEIIIILFLSLNRIRIVIFSFRHAYVRLRLWVFLINSNLHNFRRNWSLDGSVLRWL